jgi:hypothetical protein
MFIYTMVVFIEGGRIGKGSSQIRILSMTDGDKMQAASPIVQDNPDIFISVP